MKENTLPKIIEGLSSSIAIQNAISLTTSIAVLAKQNPNVFATVYKSPKAYQKETLLKSIGSIESLHELTDIKQLEFVSADNLQDVIYFMAGINDYSVFAEQVIDLMRHQRSRITDTTTSESLVGLCKALAGNVTNKKVYDAAAGLCSLVCDLGAAELELAEIKKNTWQLGKKLLILKGVTANYYLQDSLLSKEKPSAQADLVLMSPPFGVRFTTEQLLQLEQANFKLFDSQIPKSASDALWVQLALFNTNDKGRVIIVTPIGWLFRGGYDGYLRDYLLEHDLVESIIGLPTGLLDGSNIPCAVITLNKNKNSKQQGSVIFIDASDLGAKNKNKRVLTEEDIKQIMEWTTASCNDPIHVRHVLLPEIYKENNDLNVRRYLIKENEYSLPCLEEESTKLQQAQLRFEAAQTRLMQLLTDVS